MRSGTKSVSPAVHRTSFYMAKAERMALGPIKGGVIKLWREPEGGRLAVGEGIETVLAAASLPSSMFP
jgi:hypothetical protein